MARRSRLGIVVAVTGLSVALISYLALAQPASTQKGLADRPDLAGASTSDPSGTSTAQVTAAQARLWSDLKTKLLAAAAQPGASTSGAELAKELARQIGPFADSTASAAFFQKLVRTLEGIKVLSSVSRAAGYAWEGDRTGAYAVQVEEAIRKTTIAVEGIARKDGAEGAAKVTR